MGDAIGQPTRPTQPFVLSGSIKLVVSCNWMSAASVAVVVTSGERHKGKACMVLFADNTV